MVALDGAALGALQVLQLVRARVALHELHQARLDRVGVVRLVARRARPAVAGADVAAEVEVGGVLQAELRWPDLPLLAKQVALARWRVVAPGGGASVGSTPPVRVIF